MLLHHPPAAPLRRALSLSSRSLITSPVFRNLLYLTHIRISYAHFYAQDLHFSLILNTFRKTTATARTPSLRWRL